MTDKEQLSRGDALARVAVLEAELAQKSLLVREMDLMFGRMLLGMRAAVIEEEHGKGAKAAMVWIFNGLVGPGELPPEEETDAQAYFDREVKAIDEGMKQIMQERKALGAAPAPVGRVEQEPVEYQYQGRDGRWHQFMNQRHYEDTVADGTWPIRALYTTPQPAAPAPDVAGLLNRIIPRIDAGGPNPIDPDIHCCEWTLHRERERIHAEFADALAAHQSGGAES